MNTNRRGARPNPATRRATSFERPLFVRSVTAAANSQTNITDEPCVILRVSLVALSATDGYALIRDQNQTAGIRDVLAVDGATARTDYHDFGFMAPLFMPEGIHVTLSATGNLFACSVHFVELADIPWHGSYDDYRTEGAFMSDPSSSRLSRRGRFGGGSGGIDSPNGSSGSIGGEGVS